MAWLKDFNVRQMVLNRNSRWHCQPKHHVQPVCKAYSSSLHVCCSQMYLKKLLMPTHTQSTYTRSIRLAQSRLVYNSIPLRGDRTVCTPAGYGRGCYWRRSSTCRATCTMSSSATSWAKGTRSPLPMPCGQPDCTTTCWRPLLALLASSCEHSCHLPLFLLYAAALLSVCDLVVSKSKGSLYTCLASSLSAETLA